MSGGRFIPQPVGNPNNVSTINDNFDAVAEAIDNCVYRFASPPNVMQASLDMNGYPIINQANPVTLETFNWLGPWQTSTVYADGDAVFYNSTSYICVIANTSSSSFMTDLLADKWSKIDLGTAFKSSWTTNTAYFIGDIVISSNQFYYCITDHISGGTINLSNFTAYGAFGSMAAQNSTAVSISGGTISATIGNLTDGYIDNTVIGQNVQNAAYFSRAFDNYGNAQPASANQLVNFSYLGTGFTLNNFTNGSLVLPNGLYINFGQVPCNLSGSSASIAINETFTTSFPNNCLGIVVTQGPNLPTSPANFAGSFFPTNLTKSIVQGTFTLNGLANFTTTPDGILYYYAWGY